MTATLAGATIHRITCHAHADHWYWGSGGSGSWAWHGESGIPGTAPVFNHMTVTSGWPRGASREININANEFGAWQNGTRRGFGFDTSNTSSVYYGRFSSDMSKHWIEVEYTK